MQTPTEGFNVGIVPEGIKKKEKEEVEKNRQKFGGFLLFKTSHFNEDPPKAIIPVHTCEPDGHQSISHTSQQNRVPHGPVDLLCAPLNGRICRESRFQQGATWNREPGSQGAARSCSCRGAGRRNWSTQSGPRQGPLGAFKYPNEPPRKASVPFPGQGNQGALPSLPSRPAGGGGATVNPEPDPGGGTGAPRPTDTGASVIVCETSVRFGGGRCIQGEYCHLPNCPKRASSPPPLVIMAGAGLLLGNRELMNEPPRRGEKSWELSSVVLPKGAGYKSSFILTTFTLILLGAREAALRLH